MTVPRKIEDIITRNRFHPISYAPFMVAYFPLGLVLSLLRSLIFIHIYLASFLLDSIPYLRRFVIKFMCGVLGFIVTQDHSLMSPASENKNVNIEQTSTQKMAIISNHLSLFDYLILNLVQPSFTTDKRMFYWPNSCSEFNIQTDSPDKMKSIIQDRNEPVHVLPEGTPTGTTRVLLKFNSKYFNGIDVVRPMAIRAHRLFPISLVVYPLDWKRELFWQLFTPFTIYKLFPLDSVTRHPHETDEQFADRVAHLLATALNSEYVESCDSKELDRALKSSRLNDYQPSDNQSSATVASSPPNVSSSKTVKSDSDRVLPLKSTTSRVSKAMQNNIQAVLDVLPHVPFHIVLRELERCHGDVDGVITDILEDRIDLNAPPPNEIPIVLEKPDQKNSPVPPCTFLAADKTFGRKAEVRHRSFQERKKLFLENARKSYMQKHNISE